MAKLKAPTSDTSATRIAGILLRSDLSETELIELARKFARASSFPQELSRMLKAGIAVVPHQTPATADVAFGRDTDAAYEALERACNDAGLTNAQLVGVLLPIASGVRWRADPKSSRARLLTSFVKAVGTRGVHEALRRVRPTEPRDPFLDGITTRANAQGEGGDDPKSG